MVFPAINCHPQYVFMILKMIPPQKNALKMIPPPEKFSENDFPTREMHRKWFPLREMHRKWFRPQIEMHWKWFRPHPTREMHWKCFPHPTREMHWKWPPQTRNALKMTPPPTRKCTEIDFPYRNGLKIISHLLIGKFISRVTFEEMKDVTRNTMRHFLNIPKLEFQMLQPIKTHWNKCTEIRRKLTFHSLFISVLV